MSKQSKAKRYLAKLVAEHRLARLNNPEVEALKDAAHYWWAGNIAKCAAVFFPLMDRIIVEPLIGTEEYKNGERKQEIALEEQQEESSIEEGGSDFDSLFGDPAFNTEGGDYETEADRDDDGYLIR